jgi:hypothetical protein
VIYLKQDFDIHPASPGTRDRFVELAEKELVPRWRRLGARLVGGWFSNERWFSGITNVLAFEDLSAFGAYRQAAAANAEWQECERQLEEMTLQRFDELLEPLGPVAPEKLDTAIEVARDQPVGAHTLAILEVNPGMMSQFSALLEAGAARLPIIGAWSSVAGNPHQVIDLWSGALGQEGYLPANPKMESGFFLPLREIAPRERLVNLYPLPYSPLC